MARYRIRITRCYLVQVVDEDGDEKDYAYVFGDKECAKEMGRDLKKQVIKHDEEVRAWCTE